MIKISTLTTSPILTDLSSGRGTAVTIYKKKTRLTTWSGKRKSITYPKRVYTTKKTYR